MKTLITGATGFLGRNYIERIGMDPDTYVLVRQAQQFSNGAVTIVGDIGSENSLDEIRRERFGLVINFAWEGLPNLTPEYNAKNLQHQLRFLETLCETDCRIINIGSCQEYGNQVGKMSETKTPSQVSDFGLTKSMIREFLARRNANFAWIRVFYAFGPYQHKSSLLNYLYNGFKNGEKPSLQTPLLAHDFVSSETVSKIIVEICRNTEFQGVFNAGSGRLTSIGQLANELARQMNASYRYEETEDPVGMYADLAKLPLTIGIETNSEGISHFLKSKVGNCD